jgi:GH25 family lysozyme M1 (1,4-beta-N-acetylmuramidase)
MRFCFCKATEGQDYVDSKFEQNIQAIRDVQKEGVVYYPGAYHFARPDSTGGAEDGRREAEDFCDEVERVCGSIERNFLPPVLDFEKYSESDKNQNIPWIDGWIDVVQTRLKRRPMIYTGKNVWKYEVGNTDKYVDYPLWLVYYTSGTSNVPMNSLPWTTWAMWQYSGGEGYQHHPPVPGVGVVDVNRFDGTLEDLARLANAGGPVPPAPPDPTRWPSPPPQIDLNNLRGEYSKYTARVQGLLMAHLYGPDGLVGPNGLPDGMSGSKTEGYLREFKAGCGLPDNTLVDWETWWMLTLKR